MSFCLRPNVCKKCGKPLTIFEGWICLECEKIGQEPTIQEKQAESEKYQKAFDDGYANGYAQARFDYEQEPQCTEHPCLGTLCRYYKEPCDDAISREMALKECHDIVVDGERYRVIQEETLLGLPPVKQKSGKWIMSDDGLYRPICDKCGAHPWKGYIPSVEEATEVFKYCPNCGAYMVEPQESEDKE